MFGIAGEINIIAWFYVEMAEMVLGLIIKLVWLYAEDVAYRVAMDDTETALNQAYGAATYAGIGTLDLNAMVKGTAAKLALYIQFENWMYAQVMALPEDAQAKYMHGKMKMEHDDANMENMQEMTGLFLI